MALVKSGYTGLSRGGLSARGAIPGPVAYL